MQKMKQLFKRFSTLFRYGINSVVTTVVDTAIVWILVKMGISIVAANTTGVIVGFLLGYVLTAAYVFQAAKGKMGFVIYFGTFLIGLVLADYLIWLGNTRLFTAFSESVNFLLSKGLSIVVPFFVMYFLRKIMYGMLEKHTSNG